MELKPEIYTINLPVAVTMGGAYDGGGASLVGLLDHMTCYNGIISYHTTGYNLLWLVTKSFHHYYYYYKQV